MLLAIDVGNTSVTLGCVQGRKVVRQERISSRLSKAQLEKELSGLLRRWQTRLCAVEEVLVCGVVPPVTKSVESVVNRHLPVKAIVIGRDLQVPIKNCYRVPEQVGQDRLVGAYAARELYGAPVVVIDLGTATTIDLVSPRGEYLGGLIVPGLEMSAEALFQKTALLPQVKICRPKTLIGRDTESSILSGIFFGYGEMLKGLISKVSAVVKHPPRVIMTGGYAPMVKSYLAGQVDRTEPDLVLKGLALVHEKRSC